MTLSDYSSSQSVSRPTSPASGISEIGSGGKRGRQRPWPLGLWHRITRAENLVFQILFWLALYIPFEEFFLRWLPTPLAVLLRFIPELMLYALLVKVCLPKIWRGKPLKRTPVDLIVALFFLASVISMLINDSSIKQSVINLRTIWRYISVFYITVNIDISRDELRRMLKGLRLVMLAQGIIGALQYFLPASVNQAVFAPRSFEIGNYKGGSNAAEGGLKVGAVAGTFSDPAILSAFSLISLTLFFGCAYATSANLWPGWIEARNVGVIFFAIFATKKRIALALALLIPIFTLYVYGRKRKIVNMGWFYLVAGLIGVVAIVALGAMSTSVAGIDEREESVNITTYFLQLFSPEYWEHSNETARGWFTGTILNAIFSTHSWFGFGPDAWGTIEAIQDTLSTGDDIDKLRRDADVFDDGFWFAFLAYFGFVGTAIYAYMLKRLYDAGRWLTRVSKEPEYKILGATFATLIIVTALYTFAERIPRLRAFSFYFWLLAGLVVNICHIKMATIKQARQSRLLESGAYLENADEIVEREVDSY